MNIIRGSNLSFEPASHEDPNDPGVLKKILLHREELIKGNIQMINWAHMPVGKAFSAHYHESMQEVFIIISGKAEIEIDSQKETLEKGDAVVIPEKAVHIMKNVSTIPVEYIAIGITERQGGKTVNVYV